MLINVVKGSIINESGSNLENFYSDVIPTEGTTIITKKFRSNIVKSVIIDYTKVQHDNDRGVEMVFVFI